MTRAMLIASVLTVAFTVAPALVFAQQPRTPGELSIEKRRGILVVHPAPPAEVIAQDTDRAVAEMRRRDERAAREAVTRPWHRPDLDYDIHSAIQQRLIQRSR